MKLFQPDIRERRMLGATFAIAFAISILVTAFFQAQVVTGKQFLVRSEENRLRPVVIPAPRGTITDRNGSIIATSITGYSVSVLPGDSALVQGTVRDLAPFLGLAPEDVAKLLRSIRPHGLLEVTNNATYAQAAALEERRTAFPNILVVERPRRYYPAGAAIGHLVGYVGEISPRELEDSLYKALGYLQGRMIGKAGIEKQYEQQLGGKDGARFVEVDAMGRVIDPRSSVGAVSPTRGTDLKLTLDLELQKYIHTIFPDTLSGAVVAMVPSTGEVLAMYTHPTYDPNDFVGRIPTPLWRALNADSAKPLLDRTINALYPPGSTFKLATAAMGMRKGIVTADTRFPISCTGGMSFAGRYARCWDRKGHGILDLAGAIEKSCDVWFYQLGIRLGIQELTDQGTRMGFNSKSGIDLPSERRGEYPSGNAVTWWKKHFHYPPQPSEVMPLVIGQGPNSQNVLKMAEFYSAMAGDGTTRPPHLVATPDDGKRSMDLGLNAQQLAWLWEGMARVTDMEGTALQSSLERYKIMGKTGTAQNPHGGDHGWFVGIAGVPGGPPEVVVAAIVEHGLHGDATAPLASKVANFYLDRIHHHPFDPRPTLGERWRAGIKPSGAYDPQGRRLVPRVGNVRPTAAPAATDSPARAR
ncbi:MAG TPA: penicillin-binding protein 2 [Longimicrobiaceae bacterium]|nr:penicillin-binding protein 2 [Longimicrobiaceae bacterium]